MKSSSSVSSDKINSYGGFLENLPQIDVPITHYVSGEIYARHGMIPKGTTFVGTPHVKDHISVICGDISINTDDGDVIRVTGYNVVPTKAGMQRVGYAHEDTYWTTLIHTKETDVYKIEEEVTTTPNKLQTRRNLLKSAAEENTKCLSH